MDAPRSLPSEHQVHVWYASPELDVPPHLYHRLERVLSVEERERHRRFGTEADGLRYLGAHAFLRGALSHYANVDPRAWTFSRNEYGRPEIAGPPHAPRCFFSLTRTRGLTAIAFAAAPAVGIDAEFMSREYDPDIAQRFFAPTEAAAIESLPHAQRQRAFYEYWTLKEAFVKALGLGLSVPLQSFAFTHSDPPQINSRDPAFGPSPAWQFARIKLSPNHACALALRHEQAPRVDLVRVTSLADLGFATTSPLL